MAKFYEEICSMSSRSSRKHESLSDQLIKTRIANWERIFPSPGLRGSR